MEKLTDFQNLVGTFLTRRRRAEGKQQPAPAAVKKYAAEIEDLLTSRMSWPTAPIEQLVLAKARLDEMSAEFQAAKRQLESWGDSDGAMEAQEAIVNLPDGKALKRAIDARVRAEKPPLGVLEPMWLKGAELEGAEELARAPAQSEESMMNLLKVLENAADVSMRRIQTAQIAGYGPGVLQVEHDRHNRIVDAKIAAHERLREWRLENAPIEGAREMSQADFDAWNRVNPLAAMKAYNAGEVRIVG